MNATAPGQALFPRAYFETRFRATTPPDGWPQAFFVITAQATTGETWSPARNEAADRELSAHLATKTGWMHRITGYSAGTGHAEPGWAAILTREQALSTGREFLQHAIYAVNGDHLTVVLCTGGQVAPVGHFSERLDLT